MTLHAARGWIADALKRYPKAYRLVRLIYSRLVTTEYGCLWRLAQTRKDVFFLQIGAHDGKTDDKLYGFVRDYGWRGVLVEPVTYLFERLVRNYAGVQGLTFENKALAQTDGLRTFHYLRQSDDSLPAWYDQIGSLDREIILRHRHSIPDIERYLVSQLVDCVSFQSLVDAHRILRIDLIVLDTEGHDLQILQQIDFAHFSPELVIYEQIHLSAADKQTAIELLEQQGYAVCNVGLNNIARRRAR